MRPQLKSVQPVPEHEAYLDGPTARRSAALGSEPLVGLMLALEELDHALDGLQSSCGGRP
jgi:hypothetical protein